MGHRSDYFTIDALNWSSLKYMETHSPEVFDHKRRNPDPPSAAMISGSSLHKLVFERDDYEDEFMVGGPINPKTEKCYGSDSKRYKEWVAENPGKYCLTTEEYGANLNQLAALEKNDKTREILWERPGRNELVLLGSIQGVPCKGLADRIIEDVSGNVLLDLKTSSDGVRKYEISKTIANRMYHCQMAMYKHLAKQNGITIDSVKLVVSPSNSRETGLWSPNIFEIDRASLDEGWRIVQKCIKIFKECDSAGIWPSYTSLPENQTEGGIPVWAMPYEG